MQEFIVLTFTIWLLLATRGIHRHHCQRCGRRWWHVCLTCGDRQVYHDRCHTWRLL